MEGSGVVTKGMANWVHERYISIIDTGLCEIALVTVDQVQEALRRAQIVFFGECHTDLNHIEWRRDLIVDLYRDGDTILMEGGSASAKSIRNIYPTRMQQAVASWDSDKAVGQIMRVFEELNESIVHYFSFEIFINKIHKSVKRGKQARPVTHAIVCQFISNLRHAYSDWIGSSNERLTQVVRKVDEYAREFGYKKAAILVAIDALIYDGTKCLDRWQDSIQVTMCSRNLEMAQKVVESAKGNPTRRVHVSAGSAHLIRMLGRRNVGGSQSARVLRTELLSQKLTWVKLIPRPDVQSSKPTTVTKDLQASAEDQVQEDSTTLYQPLPKEERILLARMLGDEAEVSELAPVLRNLLLVRYRELHAKLSGLNSRN